MSKQKWGKAGKYRARWEKLQRGNQSNLHASELQTDNDENRMRDGIMEKANGEGSWGVIKFANTPQFPFFYLFLGAAAKWMLMKIWKVHF